MLSYLTAPFWAEEEEEIQWSITSAIESSAFVSGWEGWKVSWPMLVHWACPILPLLSLPCVGPLEASCVLQFYVPFILWDDRAFRHHSPASENKRPRHYFTRSSLSFLGVMSLLHKSRCQPTTIHMGNTCYSHCGKACFNLFAYTKWGFFSVWELIELVKRLIFKVP